MLDFNHDIEDRFLNNIYNDVVDIINRNDNMRNDVEGFIKHLIVIVVDSHNHLTSFRLEDK